MVAEGEPAEAILTAAADDPATLIAMTTHGRAGLARWVLGSVATKVLHAAVGRFCWSGRALLRASSLRRGSQQSW
ncbi:MAG: universal stress protein [SAR202 cluster bacterium]|nr:universal stress protein [SAR202 cluster bacterium]